jgi:ArsR family transcriptional regulator
MEKQSYEKFLKQLRAVAEPNRLQILDLIMSGVQCNCNLGDSLKIKPNLISHHINILEDAGFITLMRDPIDARWVYYSINKAELEEFKKLMDEFFNSSRVKPKGQFCGPLGKEIFADRFAVIDK